MPQNSNNQETTMPSPEVVAAAIRTYAAALAKGNTRPIFNGYPYIIPQGDPNTISEWPLYAPRLRRLAAHIRARTPTGINAYNSFTSTIRRISEDDERVTWPIEFRSSNKNGRVGPFAYIDDACFMAATVHDHPDRPVLPNVHLTSAAKFLASATR